MRVLEYDDYAAMRSSCGIKAQVDVVMHLVQDFPTDWDNAKATFRPMKDCPQDVTARYYEARGDSAEGGWVLDLYGGSGIARELECVKVFGDSTDHAAEVARRVSGSGASRYDSILMARFEELTHRFHEWDDEYWRQHRSLQFSAALDAEAQRFLQQVVPTADGGGFADFNPNP